MEERKKEDFDDENVDVSLVNASDNLASKSELESTEAVKFVDELNEDSLRFFANQDQENGGVGGRRRALEDNRKSLFNNDDNDEIMPDRWGSLDDLSAGLPASLIITNLPTSLFVVDEIRAEFESIFLAYDPEAQFQYFRSFKRCRVNFETSLKATLARLNCNELDFHGSLIRCFFAQIVEQRPEEDENRLLKLPALEKQFLISPPASPPVGWEQTREEEPVISFDLISRLTAMAGGTGGPHVVHPRNESCPAIVVHTCDDDLETPVGKPKIPQTRRPDPIVTN